MTTATVRIGNKDYPLAPLVFDQMERAWPFLKAHTKKITEEELEAMSEDDLAQTELKASKDAISIIAIAMSSALLELDDKLYVAPIPEDAPLHAVRARDEKIAAKIRKTMLAGEIPLIRTTITNILVDSGLSTLGNVQTELEQVVSQLQEQMSSMETSQGLSGFSSPVESKEAAGT